MNKIKVLIPLLATILLMGCAQVRITGSGNVITREEAVTGFDKVDISQSFNVDITQGENYRVVIRVDDNLVEYLNIVKQGSTLKIGLDPNRFIFMMRLVRMMKEIRLPAKSSPRYPSRRGCSSNQISNSSGVIGI